ncbi:amidohydrolase family protein [Mangrovimicrobium sediminis]|uniref:Amidohydrolase family protein n=1 Tax=Mangrovimicrobium sediminis TaxID=2562682 RepID=A0A4Z0M9D7_9GAMM|nr:amidohydrolase family protein [Haliea sp. SAOS-164]TGD76141.1 amidohydrolase family protein [Haliea sp. SAOS-164]
MPAADNSPLTFINARVYDGHRLLPGLHSVSLAQGLIGELDAPIAEDARCIDAAGLTLLPGLVTCHLHPDFYKFTLAEGLAGAQLGKELPPGVLMAVGVRTCRVLLESGFTGYVGAACAHDIDAQLKIAIAEGIIDGPRIRACGHHIGTTSDLNDSRKWWQRYTAPGIDLFGDGPQELRKLVREEIRRGVETIKIFASAGHGFPGPTPRNMARDEIAAIVDAAHERGAKVRAHVSDKAMIMECIELGVDIIDHGDEVDDEVIAAMVAAGTYWVPSLIYPKLLLQMGWGEPDGSTQVCYDNVRRMLPAAQRAGVNILVGDDYSGVFRDVMEEDPLDHEVGRYAREFAYYADIDGLTPEEVLAWGTGNPGALLAGKGPRVGVVEAGAVADLILVEGNPLEDLTLLAQPDTHLKAVLRDGRLVIDRLGERGVAGTVAGNVTNAPRQAGANP